MINIYEPNSKLGNAKRKCSIKGCKAFYWAKDFCSNHYQIWRRTGNPFSELALRQGKGYIDTNGYKRIPVNNKSVREHRHVMEQHLGRPLDRDEHIHHIDGDKLNNKIENLILISNAKHRSQHSKIYKDIKQCTKCKKDKPLSAFTFRLNNPKYSIRKKFHDSWCKTCNIKIKRERRHLKQSLNLPYS